MKKSSGFPLIMWQIMRQLNRVVLSIVYPNRFMSKRVLVLYTRGRKSGQKRETPLQYEEVDGKYYVASARGMQADWYRNLVVCPEVEVQVGVVRFSTIARCMTDINQVADFLELRIERHPHFMKAMLRMEGLPRKYTRTDLEKFSERLAIVKLDPKDQPGI